MNIIYYNTNYNIVLCYIIFIDTTKEQFQYVDQNMLVLSNKNASELVNSLKQNIVSESSSISSFPVITESIDSLFHQ